METLPVYISFIFAAITLITVWLFYIATGSIKVLIVLSLWLIFQAIIALSGFYLDTQSIPPRFGLMIIPPIIVILLLFFLPQGKTFMDTWDLRKLTLLHTIRIPVEIVLFLLATYKVIPTLMTFEGRNFDIIAGLSAPIIYYLYFKTKSLNNSKLLI